MKVFWNVRRTIIVEEKYFFANVLLQLAWQCEDSATPTDNHHFSNNSAHFSAAKNRNGHKT